MIKLGQLKTGKNCFTKCFTVGDGGWVWDIDMPVCACMGESLSACMCVVASLNFSIIAHLPDYITDSAKVQEACSVH